MPEPVREAERLLRRFARDTNLLIAGRTMRVHGDGEVGDALRHMLAAMGARLVDTDASVDFDVSTGAITLDGEPLPARADAAARLDFAAAHMPVAHARARAMTDSGVVAGVRIGLSLTLEPKTAVLALLLAQAGADVAVWAHPDETDEDVAAALRARGIEVDADSTLTREHEREAALRFVSRGFDVLVDDGSHITRLGIETGAAVRWRGATEETTSGLTPLRAMEAEGALPIPVIAANDAATKTDFDNRYGTGQSCVLAIADLLDQVDVTVRDQPALVIGYGPVGVGVAAHLRGLGAQVAVAEIDPLRALRAQHDGYRVGRADDLVRGALVVSATGVAGTITAGMLSSARVVAVAGGVPREVDWDPLDPDAAPTWLAPHVERVADALLLDRGGCINVTAAEGNPIEIMDLSFATQLAAVDALLTSSPAPGVHPLSPAVVAQVARTAAQVRHIDLDRAEPQESGFPWHLHRFWKES